jgi:hypothetical protein
MVSCAGATGISGDIVGHLSDGGALLRSQAFDARDWYVTLYPRSTQRDCAYNGRGERVVKTIPPSTPDAGRVRTSSTTTCGQLLADNGNPKPTD